MKLIIILFVCTCIFKTVLSINNLDEEWDKFKKDYGRKYSGQKEEELRKAIFAKLLQLIKDHNKMYKQGLETYQIGINKFSDYTEEEYAKYAYGLKKGETIVPTNNFSWRTVLNGKVPDSKDWKQEGAVTPIKNQGFCGSCWAFAALGSLESLYIINSNKTAILSEQQLVDCDNKSKGCAGGWMHNAYKSIIQTGGINFQEDYPYEAKNGTCRFNSSNPKITISNYVLLENVPQDELKALVANIGPIAVAIDASGPKFEAYISGVYLNSDCSNNVNHGVTIVGYGKEDGHDYWLVKNSWGTDWGQDGYIKVARNVNATCGITKYVTYPKL